MLVKFMRFVIGAVCLPFTLWNLVMEHLGKVDAPGQIIHTKNSTVHVMKTGNGPVTVILEAGLASVSIDWCYIQPDISEAATVISYDRGSYGWSQTNRKSRTSLDAVEELREVLEHLEAKPPYVLVGHSYGGLSMRLFASMYPDETAGLVLVDAVHENQYKRNGRKRFNSFRMLVALGYLLSPTGLPRLLKYKVGRKFLKKEYDQSLAYIGYKRDAYESIYSEYRDTAISAEQLSQAPPLPADMPVIVISANNSSAEWNKYQGLLSQLTKQTLQIKADSGHSVHLLKPSIVIDCILKLVYKASK